MDVDTVKTCNNNNSMDMMAMMMHMDHQKLPEFSEPFYNTLTTTHHQDNDFFHVNPNNVAHLPNLIDQNQVQPPPSNINFVNYPTMTPAPPVQASEKRNSMAAMREMIFRIAVMQPIHIDPESVKPPKRRNVKISKDPQSVAARHRRERISERIRILQRLVPGGTKMDTASMLDEAIHYVKFLKKQVQTLEQAGASSRTPVNIGVGVGFSSNNSNNLNFNYSSLLMKGCQPCQMFGSTSQQLLS